MVFYRRRPCIKTRRVTTKMLRVLGTLERALTVLQSEYANPPFLAPDETTKRWVLAVQAWLARDLITAVNVTDVNETEEIVEFGKHTVETLRADKQSTYAVTLTHKCILAQFTPIPINVLTVPFGDLVTQTCLSRSASAAWAFGGDNCYALCSCIESDEMWVEVLLVQNSIAACNAFRHIAANGFSTLTLFFFKTFANMMLPENQGKACDIQAEGTIFSGDNPIHWDAIIRCFDPEMQRIEHGNLAQGTQTKATSIVGTRAVQQVYTLPTTHQFLWIAWTDAERTRGKMCTIADDRGF